jgi:hypothetical protein
MTTQIRSAARSQSPDRTASMKPPGYQAGPHQHQAKFQNEKGSVTLGLPRVLGGGDGVRRVGQVMIPRWGWG